MFRIKKEDTFKPEVELDEHVDELAEETVESATKVEQKKQRQFDPKMKQEIANKSLAAYIDMCCTLRNVQRAYNALNYHKYKMTTGTPPINSINVYNALLKGYGQIGDLSKLEEILHSMKSDKLSPNVQTFVYLFECIGRSLHLGSTLKSMRIYSKLMTQQHITFDKIMTEGMFVNDQRAKVLAAIKLFNPEYSPKLFEPSVQYENHLVNSLNHSDQCNTSKLMSNQDVANDENNIEVKIMDQLALERSGYVTVKSVEAKGEPTEEIKKYREILAEQLKAWEEAALKAFNRDLFALMSRRSSLNMEPFFRSIPPKEFIAIITEEAVKLAQGSETYSPTVNQLYRELGSKVYLRYKVLTKQRTGALDKVIIQINYST